MILKYGKINGCMVYKNGQIHNEAMECTILKRPNYPSSRLIVCDTCSEVLVKLCFSHKFGFIYITEEEL